jgi:hypothetical protein
MDLDVASRRNDYLPTAQLHAVVPGKPRTLCALDLGEGLVVIPELSWDTPAGDHPRCPLCASGARSLGIRDA